MITAGEHSLKRAWVIDGAIAVMVFLIVFAAGYSHLRSLRQGRSAVTGYEFVYGPAVMLAQGRGFVSPDLLLYPELRAFVRGETEVLPRDAVPDVVIEAPVQLASYHRYLVYAVSLFWRWFGISWTSLEPLLALLLAWSGVAVYGVMRLGMMRPLALAAALLFMISPAMLGTLTELRDFSKAPFILSMLAGLGWLIKYKAGFRQLVFWAAFLGLLAGTGMGFRQDVFVFLPLSLVLLMVSAFRADATARWSPLITVPLCLLCFYLTAWPMLGHIEGAAHPDHHLVQGYSTKRLDNLGILPASYKPMASGSDCYVFSALQDHMRRTDGEEASRFARNSAGSDRAGRRWTLDMARLFPADLAARGYAAVLRPLRYADAYPPVFMEPTRWHKVLYAAHRGLAAHLHRFGVFYGLVVLGVLAAYQPIFALGVFLFSLYVFGYIAVQCEYRHAFHLAFLPFWILGFLADRAVAGWRAFWRQGMPDPAWRRRVLVRAVLIPVCCILILIPPLGLLRVYQARNVLPVLETCMGAERTPVPVTPQRSHGWTVFSVEDLDRQTPGSDLNALYQVVAAAIGQEWRFWHARGRYMVAEFDANAGVEWLLHKYDSSHALNDFSQLVRMPDIPEEDGVVQYYFPVYEMLLPVDEKQFMLGRNHFRGIALPDAQANAFLGLYEVDVPDDTDLLMQFASVTGTSPQRLYQRVGCCPDPVFYYQSEKNATENLNLAEAARRFGRRAEAEFFSRAQLLLSRNPETRLVIAGKLFEDGALESALDAALDVRDEEGLLKEEQASLLEMIGRQFQVRGEPGPAGEAFARAWTLIPRRESMLRLELAGLYATRGEPDKAVDNYRAALLLEPDNRTGAMNADLLLAEHFSGERRTGFWREVAEKHPGSLQPWLRLGGILETAGDPAAAARAYATAHKNHPEDAEAGMRHAAAAVETLTPEIMREILDAALKKAPELQPLAVSCLDKAARELLRLGRFEDARVLYSQAAGYDPGNEWIRLRQAEAEAAAGNASYARAGFEALLTGQYGHEAANGLNALLLDAGRERQDYWQSLDNQIPGNEHIRYFLGEARQQEGRALFEAGSYAAAAAALEMACPEPCHDAEQAALYLVAQIADTGNPDLAGRLQGVLQGEEALKQRVLTWLLSAVERLGAAGQAGRAEAAARAATMVAPESDAPWLAVVNTRIAREEYEAALTACREGLAASRTIETLARVLDELYMRLGRPGERLQDWKTMREKQPGNPVVLMHLGLAYEANGRWREAADTYDALAGLQPDSAEARLYLGNALVQAGDAEGGVASLQEGIEMGTAALPVATQTVQNAGNALLAAGRPVDAEGMFRQVISLDPKSGFSWFQLGESLFQQGKADVAIEAWEQVLTSGSGSSAAPQAARRIHQALAPGSRLDFWGRLANVPEASPSINAYYALALAAAGNVEQADRVVKSLLAAHPADAEGNMAAGMLACLRGEPEAAVDRIRTVAKERPELAGVAAAGLSEEAMKAFGGGNMAQAEALLRSARTLQPDNLLYAMQIGELLLKQGGIQEAIEEFKAVLMAVPDSPKTAGLLDEAYRLKQDPDGRLRAWREIADAHPDAELPRKYLGEGAAPR